MPSEPPTTVNNANLAIHLAQCEWKVMRLLDGMPLEHLELLDMEHLQATMTPTNVRVATEQQRLTGLSAAPGGVTAPSSALPAFAEAGAALEPRQGAATEQHDDSDHGSAGTSADSDEEVTGEHIKVLCGAPSADRRTPALFCCI